MSAGLNLEPAIDRPDDFYEALIAAHRGLDEAQSLALNSRLILLLANQIGSADVLIAAIACAAAIASSPDGPQAG